MWGWSGDEAGSTRLGLIVVVMVMVMVIAVVGSRALFYFTLLSSTLLESTIRYEPCADLLQLHLLMGVGLEDDGSVLKVLQLL